MAITKSERVKELRREAILIATSMHLDRERTDGTPVAVQHAISKLIGAAEFLAMRLGPEKAKLTVQRLLDAL